MANQTISNPLKRSLSGGHIATVDDIAFSTKTEGSGVLAYETIDKSLATKLTEIDTAISALENASDSDLEQRIAAVESAIENIGTTAENITYSYTVVDEDTQTETTTTTTVKAILDSLRNSLGGVADISEKVEEARTAATTATSAASTATAVQTSLTAQLNEKIQELTELKNSASSDAATISARIDELAEIAEQLNAVFETDGQYLIMSASEYAALETKNANTLYFCYDDTSTDVVSFTVIGTSSNTLQGNVYGGGTYAEGSEVNLVALAKSGYQFIYWDDNTTGSTDNPLIISSLSASESHVAYFEPISE